ncbi:PAS domain S-box protein [Herbaspirillum sp. SJZ099]|uniref:sensor histidine kinase n=1 Tax=Herbaspirillum sp. SJZ099 TaxID=2572916 RepID=UPI0011A65CCC|nr:PAS domain S-box protein [Herbaspirillum sp. SJZ099]TWC71251.1 PAS/PAC sensor signal transduction histidine kinase [Herbaspirillum sp. SJZ099]
MMPLLSDVHTGSDSDLLRDKLTLLLDSTGEGIYGIDLDGRCTFINRAGADMLGYRVEQVLGKNMHDLVHHSHEDGGHYPEEECPILKAFRKGESCRVDQEVFWRADGTFFPAEYSSYQIVDDGRVRGAVVTFSDISKRRQAEEQLQRAKAELELRVAERTRELSAALRQVRQLSAHAHSVREDERTRIAREIHDELGSLLVALKLDVNWMAKRVADREPVARKCEAMDRLIEAAVDNVGRIITDLRPSILDHQGLIAALEWQVQEFSEATELPCEVEFDIAPEAFAPDGAKATAAFRIFQEMLSNVARHARATQVRIAVRLTPAELAMEVEDNGVGAARDALEASTSYGVMGMRERALHFGGALTIAGARFAPADDMPGTLVCLRLPLAGRD